MCGPHSEEWELKKREAQHSYELKATVDCKRMTSQLTVVVPAVVSMPAVVAAIPAAPLQKMAAAGCSSGGGSCSCAVA